IEGKHLPMVIDDKYRTASAANDDHTRGLQLLQRRHANEISGGGSKVFAGRYFGHAGAVASKGPKMTRSSLLTLQPGKAGRLPTSDGTTMPLIVEGPFKAAGDIVTGTVTHCCHGLSRGQTSASGAADEEEVIV